MHGNLNAGHLNKGDIEACSDAGPFRQTPSTAEEMLQAIVHVQPMLYMVVGLWPYRQLT